MPTLASIASVLGTGAGLGGGRLLTAPGSGAAPSSTLLTSAAFSWARNLASATPGGYSGGGGEAGGGAGGGGGGLGSSSASSATSAAGTSGWWSDPYAGPTVLASARGVPRELLCLALHTLGGFDFGGVPLLPFAREVVMLYLDDDAPAVRLEAALAICRVLVRPYDGCLDGGALDPVLAAALQVGGLTMGGYRYDYRKV
jgi:hypothetical protein